MGDTDPGRGCPPALLSDVESTGNNVNNNNNPSAGRGVAPHAEQNGRGELERKQPVIEDVGDAASRTSEESAESLSSMNSHLAWREGPKPQSKAQPSYRMVADHSRHTNIRKESSLCSDEEMEEEVDEENENENENEEEEEVDAIEEEEEEVEEEEDEELGSEEEEIEEGKDVRGKEEPDSLYSRRDEEKSSFGLYSGMSDIISGSPQSAAPSPTPSSCSSTPSLTPNKSTVASGGLPRPNSTFGSSLVYKGSGGGLLVHHPVTPKKRVLTKTKTDHLSEELNLGYRILMELMSDYQKGSNAPFMEPIELDTDKNKDYLEVIKKPLWLKKIKEQLLDGQYKTITELIGDLRLMLENAYRYFGPVHSISKKGTASGAHDGAENSSPSQRNP